MNSILFSTENKEEEKKEPFTANSFVVFFSSNCSLHACLCLAVSACVSFAHV